MNSNELDRAEPGGPARRERIAHRAMGASRAGQTLLCSLHSVPTAACGLQPPQAYRPCWRRGRVAEGGGLLNRYRLVKAYRGFESLRLRHPPSVRPGDMGNGTYLRHG